MEINSLPIWVINLKQDEARRIFMAEQLNRLGLSFEFVEAVDGREVEKDDLGFYSPILARKLFDRELLPGELGCALSHIRLWEKMVNENIQEALILEDDIYIGTSFVGVLKHRDKLPDHWEHINFCTWTSVKPIGSPIVDIYRACIFIDFPYSTAAYLLTKGGAEKLLKGCIPIYRPIDHYFRILDLNSYGIEPRVVSLADFKSIIGRRKKPKKRFFKRKSREFIDILRSIIVFLGVPSEWIASTNVRIRKLFGRVYK